MRATSAEQALPYLFVATVRSDVLDELLQSRQFMLPFEDYVLRPMPLDRLPKINRGPRRGWRADYREGAVPAYCRRREIRGGAPASRLRAARSRQALRAGAPPSDRRLRKAR